MKYLILALLLSGCAKSEEKTAETPTPWKYYTVNGKAVRCKDDSWRECGVMLYDCDDGADYICIQGVVRRFR